jgi:nicotinamidase-related amidase
MKIFFDVDTQNDFMNRDGALYVPDAELIKPNLKKLTDYAREKNIPILGSVDKHFGTEEYKEREKELKRWGGPFPDHCITGTEGELKINETVRWTYDKQEEPLWQEIERVEAPLSRKLNYEDILADKELSRKVFYKLPYEHKKNVWDRILPWRAGREPYESYDEQESKLAKDKIRELFEKNDPRVFYSMDEIINYYLSGISPYLGVEIARIRKGSAYPLYFEKQSYDVFENPNTEVFLDRAGVKEAVVYGVATDYCVKAAALGFRRLGIEVYLVTDAVKAVAEDTGRLALEEMLAAGVKPVTTKDVLEGLI